MTMDFPKVSPLKREFLNNATQTYYKALTESSLAIDYLKDRGITGEVARDFRLGYVADPCENHDEMVGMLSIPFITPTGVSMLRFRRIQGSGHKYHQESVAHTPLFNVRDLHKPASYIAFCEGELDTVVMSALVGVPAVGLPGVGQWNKNGKFYRRLLQDYTKVYVVMDTDDKDGSGQKTASLMMKSIPNAVNILLPADVNDTYLLHGADFIKKELGLWTEEQSSEMPPSALSAA